MGVIRSKDVEPMPRMPRELTESTSLMWIFSHSNSYINRRYKEAFPESKTKLMAESYRHRYNTIGLGERAAKKLMKAFGIEYKYVKKFFFVETEEAKLERKIKEAKRKLESLKGERDE